MKTKDITIIGGGVAGLSCAQYAARANRDVAVIEQMGMGGQVLTIDEIANYPGFEKGIEGWKLAMQFEAHAKEFGAELVNAIVSDVKKDGDIFTIMAGKEEFQSKAILLATGAVHRELGVKGEAEYKGKGVSYCATCDGPFFRNKKILVVGGGDSAVQEAIFLSKLSNDVTIIHRKDRFRAQAAIVNNLEETHIKTNMNKVVHEIKGNGNKVTSVVLKDSVDGSLIEENFDAVFIFVGIIPNNELAKKIGVELDKSGYILTNEKMETSVPGVFCAGDVRNTVFRQVVTAANDGAISAHFANEYLDMIAGTSYK